MRGGRFPGGTNEGDRDVFEDSAGFHLSISMFAGLGSTFACGLSIPVVTGGARVDKLLCRMTLEEKLKLS